MEVIKTGLAAFGMSGRVFHAPFLEANPNFELTAIVERTKQLSRDAYPNSRIVQSFEELLEIEEIELVVVNTPDDTHYSFTKKAIQAGKHVVVEKPFTTSTAKGYELIEMAKEKGVSLSVFQNRRWDTDFLTVKKVLESKNLGRLVEFESTFPRYRNFLRPNSWKERAGDGAGITYNLGSHLIDQAIQLFGKPKAVFARLEAMRTGSVVDDYMLIHFIQPEFAPKVSITLKASYLMKEPEPRFILHGVQGSYIKHGFDPQEALLSQGCSPNKPNWGEEDEENWGTIHASTVNGEVRKKVPSIPGNYGAFYSNIYEHLRKNEPLLTDAKTVMDTLHVIEAAFESNRSKQVVSLQQ